MYDANAARPLGPAGVLSLGLLLTPLSAALAWTGVTPEGAEVRVDPDTHRATRTQDGVAMPLWDGVHQLDDGSVVIVRGGTAVPTRQMLETWEGAASDAAGHLCADLVEQVCGPDARCAAAPACAPARQLLIQETAERAAADSGAVTPSGGQCQAALGNAFFAPCP
jgi:hypothetical protein